jgi:hypothetical protein
MGVPRSWAHNCAGDVYFRQTGRHHSRSRRRSRQHLQRERHLFPGCQLALAEMTSFGATKKAEMLSQWFDVF